MITRLLCWEEITLRQPQVLLTGPMTGTAVEAKESDWNSGQLINNCCKTSTDGSLYVPSLCHHQKLLARHHHQPSQELGKVKQHENDKYVVGIMQSSDWGDNHPCLEHGFFQPVCRHSGCWDWDWHRDPARDVGDVFPGVASQTWKLAILDRVSAAAIDAGFQGFYHWNEIHGFLLMSSRLSRQRINIPLTQSFLLAFNHKTSSYLN